MSTPTAVATRQAALDASLKDGLRVFKALAHETRLQILRLLDEREHTVSELTAEFELAQPSISRHLAILHQADLVGRRRVGQCVRYQLKADSIDSSLRAFLGHLRQCGGGDRTVPQGRSGRPLAYGGDGGPLSLQHR